MIRRKRIKTTECTICGHSVAGNREVVASAAASFLSYRKLRFYTIKNAPRGCALGARVAGCRSNRASARECARAHSFLSYRKLRFHTIKTLRKDRTAAEWKNVACATRRRRRILLRRILFHRIETHLLRSCLVLTACPAKCAGGHS